MIINFDDIPETVNKNFKGGEKEFIANMFTDSNCKIMRGKLEPGSSIGLHQHTDSYEIIYILSGVASYLYDGGKEVAIPGQVHYCPPGSSHSMINNGSEDLVFFAVVPKTK